MLDLDKNDHQTLRLLRKRGNRRDEVLDTFNISKAKDRLISYESDISLFDQSLLSRKSLEFPVVKKWTSPRIRSVSISRMKKGNELDISCCNISISPTTRMRHKVLNFYGEIEGVKVGDWWSSRLECSYAGVHRPAFAGVHAGADGAFSIALTGCYDYDDTGFDFIYSGCKYLRGNKDNQKNSRVVTQSKNQFASGSNASLMRNLETGNPVRIIRGYKLNSAFAPARGYRYDGLYVVEKLWTSKTSLGSVVFKFFIKRCEHQPSAPWEFESSHSKNRMQSMKQSPLGHVEAMEESVGSYQAVLPRNEYPNGESIRENKSNSYVDDNKENSTLNIADRLLSYDEFTDDSVMSSADNLLLRKRRLPRKSKTKQNVKKHCERPFRNIEETSFGPGVNERSESLELFRGFSPEYYPRKMILLGFLIHDMQKKLTENQML